MWVDSSNSLSLERNSTANPQQLQRPSLDQPDAVLYIINVYSGFGVDAQIAQTPSVILDFRWGSI